MNLVTWFSESGLFCTASVWQAKLAWYTWDTGCAQGMFVEVWDVRIGCVGVLAKVLIFIVQRDEQLISLGLVIFR